MFEICMVPKYEKILWIPHPQLSKKKTLKLRENLSPIPLIPLTPFDVLEMDLGLPTACCRFLGQERNVKWKKNPIREGFLMEKGSESLLLVYRGKRLSMFWKVGIGREQLKWGGERNVQGENGGQWECQDWLNARWSGPS